MAVVIVVVRKRRPGALGRGCRGQCGHSVTFDELFDLHLSSSSLFLIALLCQLLDQDLLRDRPCLAEPEKLLKNKWLFLLAAHVPSVKWSSSGVLEIAKMKNLERINLIFVIASFSFK